MGRHTPALAHRHDPAGLAALATPGGCGSDPAAPARNDMDLDSLPPDTGGAQTALPRDPDDARRRALRPAHLPAGRHGRVDRAVPAAGLPARIGRAGRQRGRSGGPGHGAAQRPAAADRPRPVEPAASHDRGLAPVPRQLVGRGPGARADRLGRRPPPGRPHAHLPDRPEHGRLRHLELPRALRRAPSGDSLAVAAAVPICGGGSTGQAAAISGTPVWAFHGTADTVVRRSRRSTWSRPSAPSTRRWRRG